MPVSGVDMTLIGFLNDLELSLLVFYNLCFLQESIGDRDFFLSKYFWNMVVLGDTRCLSEARGVFFDGLIVEQTYLKSLKCSKCFID